MNRFSRYTFPFPYYNNYYRRTNYYNNNNPPISNINNKNIQASQSQTQTEQDNNFLSKPNSNETVWFDIFGIKLYFDDVLILSLLFFLYKEEVKDEGLFLALVLLLIS